MKLKELLEGSYWETPRPGEEDDPRSPEYNGRDYEVRYIDTKVVRKFNWEALHKQSQQSVVLQITCQFDVVDPAETFNNQVEVENVQVLAVEFQGRRLTREEAEAAFEADLQTAEALFEPATLHAFIADEVEDEYKAQSQQPKPMARF